MSSTIASTELSLLSFLEETSEVTDWYMLGLYMGVSKKDLTHIEKQSSSQGSARCRAELFDVWMKRTPNASWEQIADALAKLGETVLAEKIRASRCRVALVASPIVKIVPLDKSLVVRLSTLEREFAFLVTKFKTSLKKTKVSLEELKSFLDIRLELKGELSQVTGLDKLLQQVQPYFCLFNPVILKDIIVKFIGKPFQQQLEEYESKVDDFTKIATLSLLKEVQFLDQSSSADMPPQEVIFKLTGFWPKVTINRFQRFVDHVFEANSSALTHIRVKQGCICVSWYTRKSMIATLTACAQEKVLFMRHVGVMSLRVGETVILEQEESPTEEVEEEVCLNSVLIKAVTADCTEAVKFLLSLIDITELNCISTDETTPLILACLNNSISIAKLLLEAGADVNAQATDTWSKTALKAVCSLKIPKMDLVKLLVQSGARLVIPSETVSTLGIAAANGHVDIVQYLISEGAPVNGQDRDGKTALMHACWYGQSIVVNTLLDCGADLTIQDQKETTALHTACYNQMTECVELLLAHGADSNVRGVQEATPLIHACIRSSYTMDPSILVLLLTAGAVSNAQNDEGFTPLMAAAAYDYKEGVSVLLNAGADANIQNIFGVTALHSAAKNGFLSISELLLESGAQASLTDNDGMTPLDYAIDNNHHNVCQLLLANINSDPLPVMTETTDASPTKREEPITPQRSSQHSSAFSTLNKLQYALEYPLSPADTIKHHQADEEEGETEETNY